LDPGASEKMIVTFDTSHVGEENALEHFVLFDKGQQTGGDRKPLLQATIKATVRPSIVLERGTIVWRFSPPGIDLPDQSVRIQNRTDRRLKIRIAKNDEADFFRISHEQAMLAPQEHMDLHATLTKRLEDRPYSGRVEITADSVEGDPLSLRRFMDVKASPQSSVEAAPGSIILAPSDYKNVGNTAVKVVTISGLGKADLKVTKIDVSSSSITVTPAEKNQYKIVVTHPSDRFLNEDVTFYYRLGNQHGKVEVPVVGVF
jgi:hypothetical protein